MFSLFPLWCYLAGFLSTYEFYLNFSLSVWCSGKKKQLCGYLAGSQGQPTMCSEICCKEETEKSDKRLPFNWQKSYKDKNKLLT